MCGIAGYIQRAASDPECIDAMLSRIAHRGPDAAGVWRQRTQNGEWEAVLGHRRLSILDLDGSPQPMSTADHGFHLTYNGELYNFDQLRSDLQHNGQQHFRTKGDTEVVLNHLSLLGHAGLPHLNGMFAIALWDSRANRLLLARDRAGIKPLYWTRLPCGGIAFASELLALAAHPAAGRDICPDALSEFFFRDYVLPPRTILKGVFKLLPGQWLQWDAATQRVTTGIFWEPSRLPAKKPVDPSELTGLLFTAVKSQLVADVPIGIFLSGGIDSSLVAALATQAAGVPMSTFSIGFEDPTFDESSRSRLVARHIGSKHFHRTMTDSILLDNLDDALAALDEPIGDHSIVPTYLLSKLAAQHVKVALGGDGADELFGGYPTYLAHQMAGIYSALPAVSRRCLIEPAVRAFPVSPKYQSLGWKMKRFALRWDQTPIGRHQRWMSATDGPEINRLFGRPFPLSNGDASSGGLDGVMRFDFATYLPGSVLTKVDRASMAHGLEVRPPFLDNDVIDYAMALPARFKLRGRTTKWILKRVASQFLPKEIVYRKKQGFSVPLARWISGPLRERAEAAINSAPPEISRGVARTLLDEHNTGREDHSKTLWSLIVLDLWQTRLRRSSTAALTV